MNVHVGITLVVLKFIWISTDNVQNVSTYILL